MRKRKSIYTISDETINKILREYLPDPFPQESTVTKNLIELMKTFRQEVSKSQENTFAQYVVNNFKKYDLEYKILTDSSSNKQQIESGQNKLLHSFLFALPFTIKNYSKNISKAQNESINNTVNVLNNNTLTITQYVTLGKELYLTIKAIMLNSEAATIQEQIKKMEMSAKAIFKKQRPKKLIRIDQACEPLLEASRRLLTPYKKTHRQEPSTPTKTYPYNSLIELLNRYCHNPEKIRQPQQFLKEFRFLLTLCLLIEKKLEFTLLPRLLQNPTIMKIYNSLHKLLNYKPPKKNDRQLQAIINYFLQANSQLYIQNYISSETLRHLFNLLEDHPTYKELNIHESRKQVEKIINDVMNSPPTSLISSQGIINFFCTTNSATINDSSVTLPPTTQSSIVANVEATDNALSSLTDRDSTLDKSWPYEEKELMISEKSQENILNSIL